MNDNIVAAKLFDLFELIEVGGRALAVGGATPEQIEVMRDYILHARINYTVARARALATGDVRVASAAKQIQDVTTGLKNALTNLGNIDATLTSISNAITGSAGLLAAL